MSEHAPQPFVTKRLVWPWILGVVLVVVGSVIVFFTSFAVSALADRFVDSRDSRAVERTVRAFDDAFRDADCDAFQDVVTPELADRLFDDDFDCDAFDRAAESLLLDGEYGYTVQILDTDSDGSSATAHTRESQRDEFGDMVVDEFIYTLERSDRDWIIVGYSRL